METLVPSGVFGGWRLKFGSVRLLLWYHSLQCDQRWIFALILGHRRIGFRTRGDATPKIATYKDGGFWWPWQTARSFSGRGW